MRRVVSSHCMRVVHFSNPLHWPPTERCRGAGLGTRGGFSRLHAPILCATVKLQRCSESLALNVQQSRRPASSFCTRQFCVQAAFCAGPLVKTLLASGAHNYLEFKALAAR